MRCAFAFALNGYKEGNGSKESGPNLWNKCLFGFVFLYFFPPLSLFFLPHTLSEEE